MQYFFSRLRTRLTVIRILSCLLAIHSGLVAAEPVDVLIKAMPANSWKALPNSQMKDVCPPPYHAFFCQTVMTAWSGAAYDAGRDRLLVWGGGHSDSFYNNIFAFDLGRMTWSRLTEMPQGATGQQPTDAMNDGRLETCGYYPRAPITIDPADLQGLYLDPAHCHRPDIEAQLDLQQPRSTHSYGKPVYLPTIDALFYSGGEYYPGAQTYSPWGFRYSFKTKNWSETAIRPGFTGRGMAAVDAHGDAWYITSDGGPVARYRPAENAWDTFGPINYDVLGVGDIDRKRNQYWFLQDVGRSPPVRGYDLNNEFKLSSRTPHADIPTSGEVPPQGQRSGFVYADNRDEFVAWVGGREVYFLNPTTRRWRRAVGTGDEPTAPIPNGTFGRWRYSAKRGVFVLVNGTEQNVYLYKP
jgi:hypothetical protein